MLRLDTNLTSWSGRSCPRDPWSQGLTLWALLPLTPLVKEPLRSGGCHPLLATHPTHPCKPQGGGCSMTQEESLRARKVTPGFPGILKYCNFLCKAHAPSSRLSFPVLSPMARRACSSLTQRTSPGLSSPRPLLARSAQAASGGVCSQLPIVQYPHVAIRSWSPQRTSKSRGGRVTAGEPPPFPAAPCPGTRPSLFPGLSRVSHGRREEARESKCAIKLRAETAIFFPSLRPGRTPAEQRKGSAGWRAAHFPGPRRGNRKTEPVSGSLRK